VELMPKIGDRVRITGIMRDDPCPMEVGAVGTIDWVGTPGPLMQYGVKWDSGRSLGLLPGDPFTVIPTARCLHCGGQLDHYDGIWHHREGKPFPHAACPDGFNPDNWRYR
jgi:hypothetical protein